MLSAVGFGQDKRILACATMRGKRCPKHAALRFALVSKIRVLKGWFSPENGDCSLIEHLGRGMKVVYDVTLSPHFSHPTTSIMTEVLIVSRYILFQGNLLTTIFRHINPNFRKHTLFYRYGHRQDLGLYQTKQKSPGFKRPYTRLESVDGFQRLDNVALYTIREGKKIFVGL